MNSAGVTIEDFKSYYRAVMIKSAYYWYIKQACRSMGQNRGPRRKPTQLGTPSFGKEAPNIRWEEACSVTGAGGPECGAAPMEITSESLSLHPSPLQAEQGPRFKARDP